MITPKEKQLLYRVIAEARCFIAQVTTLAACAVEPIPTRVLYSKRNTRYCVAPYLIIHSQAITRQSFYL